MHEQPSEVLAVRALINELCLHELCSHPTTNFSHKLQYFDVPRKCCSVGPSTCLPCCAFSRQALLRNQLGYVVLRCAAL
jgi:hypothetical protein